MLFTRIYSHKLLSGCELCLWKANFTHFHLLVHRWITRHFHPFHFDFNIMFCIINNIFMFFLFSYPTTYKNYPVSKAKILGNPELYIKSGNDINLTCTTSQVTNPPSFIYWYKGGRVVNYSQRGGINVSTDRTTKTSNLIISRAAPSDSGNYTCAPSNSGKLIKLIDSIDVDCTTRLCLQCIKLLWELEHGVLTELVIL